MKRVNVKSEITTGNIGDFLDYIRATQEKNLLKEVIRNLCADFEHDLARNKVQS